MITIHLLSLHTKNVITKTIKLQCVPRIMQIVFGCEKEKTRG